MTRNRTSSAVLSRLRSALPSFLAFAGLTTVIIGILAMHVWMGGHGSTPHHLGASPATSTSLLAGAEPSASAGHTPSEQAGSGTLQTHAQTGTAVVDAVTSAAVHAWGQGSDGGVLAGCGGDCSDEMMLGMCVLAMIVVGIAGLLGPVGRALLSALGRRGPPVLFWASRPAPAPSLTQLCISRT